MIAIIDYGMGNLGSIQNIFKKIGEENVITNDHEVLKRANKLILPGVGAFGMAMESLSRLKLIPLLNKLVIEEEKQILGICLGMQLFSKSSEESSLPGLGWIDSDTIKFHFNQNEAHRIPHMGWNEISIQRENPFLHGFDVPPRFYFVHSYHVHCRNTDDVLATSQYGTTFAAAVNRKNIWGTQFHPEKSHKFGFQILKNFTQM